MSSDDVIELGSSDEDPEPAPKRSKPMPNAMVCIPRKLHEVTIKPAKSNSTSRLNKPITIPKSSKISPSNLSKVVGKTVTVTKVPSTKPQTAIKNKLNGRPVTIQPLRPKVGFNPFSDSQKPIFVQNKPSNSKLALIKTGNLKPSSGSFLKAPIRIQSPKHLNLPSSITVRKKPPTPILLLNAQVPKTLHQNTYSNNLTIGDVLTVELDDDETPTHNSSPQWYLRPEEQTESSVLENSEECKKEVSNKEDENNKEPEAPKLIEITIEDSPVKPVHNKRAHEVGTELAITIDDSPVKAAVTSKRKASSDSENDNIGKDKQSKKRLEYPKETENRQTIEIEIDPHQITTDTYGKLNNAAVVNVSDNKKPLEVVTENNSSTPSKSTKEILISDSNEFHPVYQSFINLCFKLENSDDMKKIVEKKIKGYYRQVPKEYTESEEFIDMVSSKILSMKASPEKMYLYIKDIVDELNLQRKFAKSQPQDKDVKNEEPADTYSAECKYDSKRQRQIRKLEKTIKKLHRAIQKLEEQEVDFDDEDDSVYLLTERYKERMVRVYAKFCQLSNTKMPSEPRIQIDARPGRPSGPAKRLEKWINKKVPIGTPLPFPDFHDVLRCVREANEADNLNFNEADIMEEARDLFTRCGQKLQRRRQENEWRLAASRIALDVDPAENNDDLKEKLNENRKIAANKETEIFNKFADRQNQLKLEAKEIGDKEAEESPIESEDEEVNDESVSLENTEKRKERLKRLLQEKSRKSTDEKENQLSNVDHKDTNDGKTSEVTMGLDEPEKLKMDSEKSEMKDGDEVNEDTKQNNKKKEANADEKNEQSNKKQETDIKTDKDPNNEMATQNVSETQTLSDDSSALESDIDELHLLQKLHSGNEGRSSTAESTDSESPIAISDSLESSDSDNQKEISDAGDIISIENSSYSEEEIDKIGNTQESNTDSVQFIEETKTQDSEAVIPGGIDIEVPNDEPVHAPPQTNNDECAGAVEDILLASSDDEDNENSQDDLSESVCVNLRDDLISIDETVVGHGYNTSELQVEKQSNSENDGGINSVAGSTDVDLSKVDDVMNSDQRDKQEAPQKNLDQTNKEESPQINCHIILDDKSNESVEKMDVDDENVDNETQKCVTSEENIPTLSLQTS